MQYAQTQKDKQKSPGQPRAIRRALVARASLALLGGLLLVGWVVPNSASSTKVESSTPSTVEETQVSDSLVPETPPVNMAVVEGAIQQYEADQQQQAFDAFLASLPKPKPKPIPVAPKPQVTQNAPQEAPQAPVASGGGSVWDSIAQCETGGDWSHPIVSGGYSGGLMFLSSTWTAMGGGAYSQYAYQASRDEQIVIAEKILASGGWSQWPGCSRKLGLR